MTVHDGLKYALQQAANEVRRSEQLSQQGFIAPTKLEDARLAAVAAQKEVEAANADRQVATFDLAQARAALSAVRQPAGDTARRSFTVNAPVSGRVLRLLQTSEAMVAMGTPLLEIGDTRRLEIIAELLTTDALAATPGSRVMIERWGGPAMLEGRVRSVEPAAFTKVSALGVEEQRVRVLIDIASPPEQWQALGDGYRVSVRIVTLAEDKAVQVPVSAVFPLPDGADSGDGNGSEGRRFAVFVVDGGRARQRAVDVAGRNGSAAWITKGLAPGQQVIVYPPAAVRDGVRVATRKV
jgi:HlyD family secretion protein